jgi:arabinogalactan oligomer / maltooligosaccharide transport system substrate-binding protein
LKGPWSTGSLTGHAGEDNIRILPINQVTVNGKPLLHWKGGWGVGVNARLEGQDAEMALAQALIAELINPAICCRFL